MIAQLVYQFSGLLNVFIVACAGAAMLFFVLRAVGGRGGQLTKRRDRAAKQREKDRLNVDHAIAQQEFQLAIGMTKKRYTTVSLVVALAVALVVLIFVRSPALAFSIGLIIFNYRRGRANGRLNALRAGLLADEVVPTSLQIAESMKSGMSLTQSLTDVTRAGGDTPLKRNLRRALSDSRGLEEGLRDEERRSQHEILHEFFEILADGASVARQTAVTAETLDKFADINRRRRASYQNALRLTAQSRGTRSMLLLIVPGMYGIQCLTGSGETLLHSFAGNVITLGIFGCLAMATLVTNKIIAGATKGF